MNSTSMKIKKFLSNRNTVTIICAIIGVAVLYIGYNMRVQSAIKPISVPYAKVTIQPRTEITDDMIGFMEVASAAIEKMGKNVILCDNQADPNAETSCAKKLIGHYANINTMIPQGSLFYEGAVVEKSDLPDAAVFDIKEGETLYYLNVNMSTSYVNSIVPGGYIDLYVRTTDRTTGEVKVGKFIENIKVLGVKTGDGLNVFENTDEQRVPAYIIFAVPSDQHIYLLMAAELGLSVLPVPININLEDETPTASVMTSTQLTDYIDTLASEFLQDEFFEENDPENNDGNNNQNNQNNQNNNQTQNNNNKNGG